MFYTVERKRDDVFVISWNYLAQSAKKYPIAKLKIFRSVADDTAKAVRVTFESEDRLDT